METALVTGANKGIGREIARRLVAEGMTVYLGARDEVRGKEAAEAVGARFVRLDVTDEESVAEAVAGLSSLDVLVNNAGVAVDWGVEAADLSAALMREAFEVNVFGVVTVTRACVPLLRRAQAGRIVNLSSPLGSLTLLSDFDSPIAEPQLLAYSSSKAALNALTLVYARALAPIRVNAVNPGLIATDLNGFPPGEGVGTVAQGAEVPVRLALGDGGTGGFHGEDVSSVGGRVPW
ncbi:SDR family NAD(P)-dependent oxidoreductase [Actinophytocola glycyrrhizae]|uniref:SDR family NAD(P)-dependent oxidoreductase n=1 Tax=Actinophytocola glycyrrhizae TaxID=2044873 RepID=A0ABV9S4E0_9PSEU